MDWQLPFFIPSSLTTCRTAQGNAGSETCISINHSTCLPTSVRQVIQSFNPSILKKLTACLPMAIAVKLSNFQYPRKACLAGRQGLIAIGFK
jgi:hypothetical protein